MEDGGSLNMIQQIKTKLEEGGQIVIPPEFLQALGLKVGDTVIIRLEEEEVCIFTSRQAIRKAQELVREYLPEDKSLSDELIAERRLEE
jgi:bifunctional DNA-binding transcriptional regulator/antitoxin component of YhaV-PrlF toxin-antitoxin module